MLHQILRTEAGSVNGATHIVRNISYITDEEYSHLEMITACFLVEFPSYRGPTLLPAVIPIAPVSVHVQKMA